MMPSKLENTDSHGDSKFWGLYVKLHTLSNGFDCLHQTGVLCGELIGPLIEAMTRWLQLYL